MELLGLVGKSGFTPKYGIVMAQVPTPDPAISKITVLMDDFTYETFNYRNDEPVPRARSVCGGTDASHKMAN